MAGPRACVLGLGLVLAPLAAAADQLTIDEVTWDPAVVGEVVDSGLPTYAQRDDRVVLLWRRDHLGVLDLDAHLRPARVSTTLDGALRLPGAPPIALELIDGLTSNWGAAPVELPGGTGGVVTITTLTGRETPVADARLAVGRSGRLSATIADELVPHRAWFADGVVLDQTEAGLSAQGLTAMEVKLGEARTLAGSLVVSQAPDHSGDTWGQIHTTLESGRRTIEVGVVGERLDRGPGRALRVTDRFAAPRVVDRLGGRLSLRTTVDHHALVVGGEIGGGHADGAVHTDGRTYVGDRWEIDSDLVVDAALRWDRRTLGGATVELWSPRVEVMYDPDGDRASQLFATVERDGGLDEGSLGAWRSGAVGHDSVTAGYAGTWGHLRWNAALQGRDPIAGGPAAGGVAATGRWLLPAHHLDAQVEVSTLDRAATLSASWSCGCESDELQLTAIARATPDQVGWGALAAIEHSPDGDGRQLVTSLGVEVLDLGDAAGPSGHLVIEGRY